MLFQKNLKDSGFHEKETDQSLHFWSNFDHPFISEDGQHRKDIISGGEKIHPMSYPNMSESRLNLLSPLDIWPVSGQEFLDIETTVECRFTLKWARDMMITYSQIY